MNEARLNILLARWAENRLSGPEIAELRAELARDPTLADVVAGLVEVDGLSHVGTLKPPSTEEAAAMLQQLQVWGQDPGFDAAGTGDELGAGNDLDNDAVRNDDALASMFSGKETQDMIPIFNQRQQAINDVFGNSPAQEAPENVGRPGAADLFSLNVRQEYIDNCAIKCQQLILEEFGIEVSADELARMAYANGWYMPGNGTLMDDVGNILEAYGIEVTHYDNANIFNLVAELAQGRQIIIAVDSGSMWSSNEIIRDLVGMHPALYSDGFADHAVIVSGVDISDPNNPVVIITDPGTGQIAAEYPLADFLDAWEDSGFRMVSTNISPEQFQAAHVDYIGEIPYDAYAQWYPQLSGLTGAETFFQQLCDAFRHHLHNPLADAMTNLFQSVPGFQSPPPLDVAGDFLGAGGATDNFQGDDATSDDESDGDGLFG